MSAGPFGKADLSAATSNGDERKNTVTAQGFPLHLLVEFPHGTVPLDNRLAREALPGSAAPPDAGILYGPYLEALAAFLSRDSFTPLRQALEEHLQLPVPLESIRAVRIVSVKHGAIYHVARILANVAGNECSLAVNTAMRPEQQAFLENEFNLLRELQGTLDRSCLPRPCLLGEASYRDGANPAKSFMLSILEWFDDFHEFHYSRQEPRKVQAVRVWAGGREDLFLDTEQEQLLYGDAAAILTAYLDARDFRQIYPWHHAAGDFVVRVSGKDLNVRLITARDYRSLLSLDRDPEAIWIGIAHFFLNLSLRMRLDRWDGTGDLVWAGAHILEGVIAGFLHSWSQKAGKQPALPSASHVIDVLRSFDGDEWLALAEIVLPQATIENEETSFLEAHLETHVSELASAMAGDGFRRLVAKIGT
jgi:hypothetical protein